MASISKHIRRLRTAKHMTQEELAEKLFVTRQAVSAWETEKALPDVETLERIAEALGVEVTEIIYGSALQSPNPRRLKRRWALTGAGFAVILAVLMIITLKNGVYATWKHGLAFQFTDSNYQIFYEDIPNSFSVELDLKDLESNVGKVLYADESGCRVLVDSVDENRQGEYRVWFRGHGVYARDGGQLVSGCQSMRVDKVTWTMSTTAAMTAAVNGSRYPCSQAGTSGLIYKDGNQFGFHLNPRVPDTWEAIPIGGLDKLTVTVSGLTRFSTHRISYWDLY